jgi:glucosyl-3-phosphoglycerate synthase
VVISMNGVAADQVERVTEFWRNLKLPHVVLESDGQALLDHLGQSGIPAEPGKGLNIWLALGWLALHRKCGTIVIHDCDILNYDLDLPYSLAIPTSSLGYSYCQGYYSRVRDELYGRVTRLFMIPLVRSLMRVLGHMPMLDFIDSFRYPLSGECSFASETAFNLPVETGWGLEIGWLCELHRRTDPSAVCQVDLAILYDHKHQTLDAAQPATGLFRMASEIARSLLTHLEREGSRLDAMTLEALVQAYRTGSADFVRRYGDVARLNGFPFDESRELEAIRAFASALEKRCGDFLAGGRAKCLPPWRQLMATGFEPRFQRLALRV